MKRYVCGLAAALALTGVAVADNASDPNGTFPACDLIGFDDFNSGGQFISRTITPDNSANNGAFTSSNFDVFGITDRTINFDFADDSLSIFTGDTFGVMTENAPTNGVFGVEDINNGSNPSGTGSAEWVFDISGATDLKVQIRMAAMGDFESTDTFSFTYEIDSNGQNTLFGTIITQENVGGFLYTLDSGNINNIDDPLSLGDPNNGGTFLSNCFEEFEQAIAGTGSTLTIRFNAEADGGTEVFAFDDLRICGTVPNLPPVADAGNDQTVTDNDITLDEDVTLDGTGSSDPEGPLANYEWFINAISVATGPTPTLTFPLGTTTVTLEVTDAGGKTATDTVDITVLPGGDAPIANAGNEQEVTSTSKTAPVNVSLDGSGSSDADGTVVSYSWRENGVEIATGVNPTVSLDPGLHTIVLEVADNATNTARDAVYVKVLPAGVFARHDFDGNLDAAVSIDPIPGTFTSPGDGFAVFQRNVSASVPFGLLDDSGSAAPAEPNIAGECSVFGGDTGGIWFCAKQDAFFGVIDLFNADNPNCDAGTATFTFDISGRSDISVLIDMGASGNFEANPDPNDPNGPVCDPNSFGVLDAYDWTYSIDGSAPAPLFTSGVDEAGSVNQEMFNGNIVVIDDPLTMNGTTLDNNARTISAAVAGTGSSLTITLNARGDSGSEGYVFDDIILCEGSAGPTCGANCQINGACADTDLDGDVDLTDLANVLANFGGAGLGDTDGDGDVDLTDLANVLALFGAVCP